MRRGGFASLSRHGESPPNLLTHRQYVAVYCGEPRVRLYMALALCTSIGTLALFGEQLAVLAGVAVGLLPEPFVEYGIHRFVFHSRLYRFEVAADFWKHMHYDHHQDPNNQHEIFGPAEMMVPFAIAITLPLGWLAGGMAGGAGALATGLWVLVIYEYFHGAAHLLAEPPTAYGRWLKRIHALHHFHNEKGNFGVITPICDLLFGTYYAGPGAVPRSPTVRNIGCTEEEAHRYPWVRWLGEERPDPR